MNRRFVRLPILRNWFVAAVACAALPAAAVSQQADKSSAENVAEVLDLGDCPETPSGFETSHVYACSCAAETNPGTIYGSEIYTDDSNICTAVVHAGVLKRGAAGSVALEMVASSRVFKGLTKNGVKSELWLKPTALAFRFVPQK